MSLNRTLSNAQLLIELLAERGPLTPADIAAQTGIARSSVYRLAEGLAAVGLADLLPDSRIRLGNQWMHVADAVEPAMKEWSEARRVLDMLADETGQTIYLSVLRGEQAICLAWAQGRGIDLLVLKPGRTLPLYAGAAGRNILAHSPELVDRVLADAPLPALTTRTLTDAKALRADIDQSLAEGHTFSDEDVTIGIAAIGVPVMNGSRFMGCLSAAGLADDIRGQRTALVVSLSDAAAELAATPPLEQ